MTPSTPLNIFRTHQAKYREITFVPENRFGNDGTFVLRPRFKNPDRYFDWNQGMGMIPGLSIRKCGLKISFEFNPMGPRGVHEQLDIAIGQAVKDQILNTRSFFIEIDDDKVEQVLTQPGTFGCIGYRYIPWTLKIIGPPLEGLRLRARAAPWNFFVPEESTEGREIKEAIRITNLELRHKRTAAA